jgi:tetratricopeptide (TPR) repeat protein
MRRRLAALLLGLLPWLASADGVKLDSSGPDERLRIEGRINGHAVAVALDTGLDCGYLLFRSDLPPLGLAVPAPPAAATATPGKYPFILAAACTWDVLGTSLPGIHPLVLTVPGRFLREEAGLAGLIGWPAVHDNIWVFNLGAGRIGVAPSVPPSAAGWEHFALKTDLRILSLEAQSGPKLPRILIDTGNADGILLPADAWRAWRAAHPQAPATISADWMVGQGERAEEQVWADTFVLGDIVLHGVPVQEEDEAYTNMSPGEPVIAIGLAALERLDVVLDGPRHAAYVRASPAPAPPFPHNRLGAAFLSAEAPGSPQIATAAIPGTPGALAGLRPGDVLVSVNGRPATRESYWKKPAGTTYDLVVRRGDQQVPLTVVLRDLIGPAAPAAAGADAIVAYPPRAVTLDRADEQYLLVTGLAEADRGNFAGAIADYTRAIAVNPAFAPAYCARAESREAEGDAADARADLDRAIALNPGYAEAFDNRGRTEAAQGDLPAAVADYGRAIAANPKAADPYNQRGEIERQQGDATAALADFDRAIALQPASAEAYGNRASLELDAGDWAAAVADCNRALALNPRDGEAYNNRGAAQADAGNFAGARADFGRAIALNPKNPALYDNRGACENAAGDFAAALADFSRALALNPQDAAAYRGRGIARDATGDLVGALADYCNASPTPARTDLFLRFRISLVLRRLQMDDADTDLVEAVEGAEPGWGKTVGSYLIGALSEPELLAAAASAGPDGRAERECEADYYIAITHLLRKETAAARASLAQCVATGATGTEEFTLAQGELARLANPPA